MSEFRKRKLRTFFTLFDFDKDGVILREHWIGMATLYAQFEKADRKKSDYLAGTFEKVWNKYVKFVDNKDRLTIDEFVDSIVKQCYDEELMRLEDDLIRGLFNLMDVNCDGYLQEDEHKSLFIKCGMQDTSFSRDAFKTIDTDGDGKLSIDEYITSFYEYLFSEDENSPNKHYFGPLVD